LARVVWTDGDQFSDGIAHELSDINLGSSTVGPNGGTDYIAATTDLIPVIGTENNSDNIGTPGAAGNPVIPEPGSLVLLIGSITLLMASRSRR